MSREFKISHKASIVWEKQKSFLPARRAVSNPPNGWGAALNATNGTPCLKKEWLQHLQPGSQQEPTLTNQPTPISHIAADLEKRLFTGIGEFDRVLGGGVVQDRWC